jgi:hypothetical protein
MSSTKPSLVIMAAGIGSRYGGLKQIEPVGPHGEILMDYAIFDAIRAGFAEIVFVIRREIENDFRPMVESRWKGRITLSYVFQELGDLPPGFALPADRTKPWGTGHAVYACRKSVRGAFGVINADDFYGPSSFKLLSERLAKLPLDQSDYTLIAFTLRNTLSPHGAVARGVCTLTKDGYLNAIEERAGVELCGNAAQCVVNGKPMSLTGDEAVSMNLWGFTPTLFEHLDREFAAFLPVGLANPKSEFMLPAVVDSVIRRGIGKVDVVRSNERWLGVTYPQDRETVIEGVRALIKKGQYPEAL